MTERTGSRQNRGASTPGDNPLMEIAVFAALSAVAAVGIAHDTPRPPVRQPLAAEFKIPAAVGVIDVGPGIVLNLQQGADASGFGSARYASHEVGVTVRGNRIELESKRWGLTPQMMAPVEVTITMASFEGVIVRDDARVNLGAMRQDASFFVRTISSAPVLHLPAVAAHDRFQPAGLLFDQVGHEPAIDFSRARSLLSGGIPIRYTSTSGRSGVTETLTGAAALGKLISLSGRFPMTHPKVMTPGVGAPVRPEKALLLTSTEQDDGDSVEIPPSRPTA